MIKETLAIGGIIVIAGLAWLVVGEFRRSPGSRPPPVHAGSIPCERVWTWLFPLSLFIFLGALARLFEIDLKTLTHPEIYIPGLPLPPDISEPPPRLTVGETMSWHFFSEPHPWGYYLAMLGWTKVFGTSAAAIRLPAALLGIASIPVIFRIASLCYGRSTGWVASAFLALHGFHIFWSQAARMYVPVCFFGLVATWLLLEIHYVRRESKWLEVAYVCSIVAGLMTEWFFWLIIAGHVLWSILNYLCGHESVRRVLYFQLLGIVLGAHTLSHLVNSVWHAASGARFGWWDGISYLLFGYLFDLPSWSEAVPDWLVLFGFVLAIGLLFQGLTIQPARFNAAREQAGPGFAALAVAALGMTVFMFGLAMLTSKYSTVWGARKLAWPISVFPILTVAILPFADAAKSFLQARLGRAWLGTSLVYISPIMILAFLMPLAVFIVSFLKPMVAARAMLIFAPYLLIITAAGAVKLGRRPVVGVPLSVILAGLFIVSIFYFHHSPSSPRDYQGIAEAMQKRLEPDDRIFVISRHWLTTPVFYYLNPSQLVAGDYAENVAAHPEARVWVIILSEKGGTDAMMAALQDYRLVEEVTAQKARGLLYVRPSNPHNLGTGSSTDRK